VGPRSGSPPLSVKSGGDFPDILAQEDPELWQAHKAGGGATGKLLRQIIQQATEIKAIRQAQQEEEVLTPNK